MLAQADPIVENVPAEVWPVLMIVLGLVVLLFGRSLYWAFVAIVGFVVGMHLANAYLVDQQAWVRFLVAVGAGLIGAILAIFIQRLAFAIGGFFAGGYLAVMIAQRLNIGGDHQVWMIVGGVLGAIVAALVMDWAIIILSAMVGAAMIVSVFESRVGPGVAGLIFLALAVVGAIIQARQLVGTRALAPPTEPPPP